MKSREFNRTFNKQLIKTVEVQRKQPKTILSPDVEFFDSKSGKFVKRDDLLQAIKFKRRNYRRIPEFPTYYISNVGAILSVKSTTIRVMTPQFITKANGTISGPVARLRDGKGGYFTRSVAKIVENIWFKGATT